MSRKKRRQYSAQEKVQIIREHLVDQIPVSQLCEKHDIHPAMFYQWQKTFFENGTAAFERQSSHSRVRSSEQAKIAQLEKKIQRKDEAMAELMTEHIRLKKDLGES